MLMAGSQLASSNSILKKSEFIVSHNDSLIQKSWSLLSYQYAEKFPRLSDAVRNLSVIFKDNFSFSGQVGSICKGCFAQLWDFVCMPRNTFGLFINYHLFVIFTLPLLLKRKQNSKNLFLHWLINPIPLSPKLNSSPLLGRSGIFNPPWSEGSTMFSVDLIPPDHVE